MEEVKICRCECHMDYACFDHCEPCCHISMYSGEKYLNLDGSIDMERYNRSIENIEKKLFRLRNANDKEG